MAAIDFPSAPILNQVFAANNGVSYIWNGSIWITVSSGAAQASDTPPSNPVVNQLWFNSALGQLFIYYNDGSSSQWVPANPTPSGVPVGGGIVREVTLSSAAATIDLFSLGVKSVKLLFKIQGVSNGDVNLRIASSSTVNTSANYSTVAMQNHHTVTTPAGFVLLSLTTGFRIGNGVASTSYATGEITFPDITTVPRAGSAIVNYHGSDTNHYNAVLTLNGGTVVGDGLQFSHSGGNIAAGSFVRVIGWQ